MICAASCLIKSRVSLFLEVKIDTVLSFSIVLFKSHNSPLTSATKASDANLGDISEAICNAVTGLL